MGRLCTLVQSCNNVLITYTGTYPMCTHSPLQLTSPRCIQACLLPLPNHLYSPQSTTSSTSNVCTAPDSKYDEN